MVRKSKANWWLVFALLPLMIVLLVGETFLPESPLGHGVFEVGIVVVTFGLMALWVHANADALIEEDYAAHSWIMTDVSSEEARTVDALPLADCLDETGEQREEMDSPSLVHRKN